MNSVSTGLHVNPELSNEKIIVQGEDCLNYSSQKTVNDLSVLLESDNVLSKEPFTYENIPSSENVNNPVQRGSNMYLIHLPEDIEIEEVYEYLKEQQSLLNGLIEPYFNRTSTTDSDTGIVIKIRGMIPQGNYIPPSQADKQNDIRGIIDNVMSELKQKFEDKE